MLPSRFLFPWPRSLVAHQRQNVGAGGARGVQDFLGVGAVVFVCVWVAMMGLGLRWALGLRWVLSVTGFFLMAGVSGADEGREGGGLASAPLGRLALEDSSFLRASATSRVRWYRWGPEAWAEAARSGRPVFLSVGYFSCPWTARMDREVFMDPATAERLNEKCVPVRIDRFERPEVDHFCRRFIESTHGRSGWPLNLWMTAEKWPLRAVSSLSLADEGWGSFPREIDYFLDAWTRHADAWQKQAIVEGQQLDLKEGPEAAAVAGPDVGPDVDHDVGHAEALAAAAAAAAAEEPPAASSLAASPRAAVRWPIDRAVVDTGRQQILSQFDPVHGGFGRAPKFPPASRLGVLMTVAAGLAEGSTLHREMSHVVEATLDGMAGGAIRDPLGGGFFRYAMDDGWRRPAFEKSSLDQAMVADMYLAGYELTGREAFAVIVREVLEYAIRELGQADGGFFNGESGESGFVGQGGVELREGAYYLWGRDEVRRCTGLAADLMELIFDVQARGNVPPGSPGSAGLEGQNILAERMLWSRAAAILNLPEPQAKEWAAAGRAQLSAARRQRIRPALDRLMITQVNAALVSSLARAGRRIGAPEFLERAVRGAEFIRHQLWNANDATLYRCRLDRAPRHRAVADDYVFLVRALLDLHESTGELRWLQWADDVQRALETHHADDRGGGYFEARRGQSEVPVFLKSDDDAGGLSANAVAGLNLLRWAGLMQRPESTAAAARLLQAFAWPLRARAASVSGLVHVAAESMHPRKRIILIGAPDLPDMVAARALLAAHRCHLLSIEDAAAGAWLQQRQAVPAAVVVAASASASAASPSTPAFFMTDGSAIEQGPLPLDKLPEFLPNRP